MTVRNSIRVLGLALAVLPGTAFAHPGHELVSGAAGGLMHPFTGLDHILAMLLVGVFAYQLGGRALWALPLTFLAAMAAGGLLGSAGPESWMVETGIALSVIGLGAAVALNVRAPVALAAAAVGVFAVFHGFAHGAEMPATADAVSYGAGFMLGTAILIVTGIGAAFALNKARGEPAGGLMRSAGTVAAVAGVGILTGMV